MVHWLDKISIGKVKRKNRTKRAGVGEANLYPILFLQHYFSMFENLRTQL